MQFNMLDDSSKSIISLSYITFGEISKGFPNNKFIFMVSFLKSVIFHVKFSFELSNLLSNCL